MDADHSDLRALLLRRKGLAFLDSTRAPVDADDALVRAIELELADLGYVVSMRLRARLVAASLDELKAWRTWVLAVLAADSGGDRKHEPLFRSFPDDIPRDTQALWLQRVLVHLAQSEGQPCLFCCRIGTTHVLAPCLHVVCDRCFDGARYAACPICGHAVDRASPFFEPSRERSLSPRERVTYKLLDRGDDLDAHAKELLASLCARAQALAPDDREALAIVIRHYGRHVFGWLPAAIPVRETTALIFGLLLQTCEAEAALGAARPYLATATDVLRLIAAYSGADPALQGETVLKSILVSETRSAFWNKVRSRQGRHLHPEARVTVPVEVRRFKVAPLARRTRRTLLAFLEQLDADALVEDMLRHRSYWVWLGEFLHPHEYQKRFPNVARAFHAVRGKSPDGARAPRFRGFASQVEAAARAADTSAMLHLLTRRPGELARRFDQMVRLAGDDAIAARAVVDAFTAQVPHLKTPMLTSLYALLPTRVRQATVRVYWPKGQTTTGISSADTRRTLPAHVTAAAADAIEVELLSRFATKERFDDFILDEALRQIVVPFNERTASRSAVSLPRGSRVAVPQGKLVRLFLHWCEPERGGIRTDIDLSVAFYDAAWTHVGTCSYYQLTTLGKEGAEIAKSAGDLRNAPFPDGATELVDIHRERALAEGMRYAVMVVNNYSGMPFSRLERGFAGVMLRDDAHGAHFDPRTVHLRFALNGENGIFLPLVLDLENNELHWLDVYSQGELALNNVATSNRAITKVCPALMTYFASGARPSLYDVALLHAAARARRVLIRRDRPVLFVRQAEESAHAFYRRLVAGGADEANVRLPDPKGARVLAVLHRGDLDLAPGSSVYALFRERVSPTLAASDFVS